MSSSNDNNNNNAVAASMKLSAKVTAVIVNKHGIASDLVIDRNLDESTLYQKCNFRWDPSHFKKHHSYLVKYQKDRYRIDLFGSLVGKASLENKYELPPPIDKQLFFGSICLVGYKNGEIFHFRTQLWEKLYEKLFGGFEDLNNKQLIKEDEEEVDELAGVPKSMKTRDGYLKDNFVVSSSDDEGEDESIASSSSSSSTTTDSENENDDDEDNKANEESRLYKGLSVKRARPSSSTSKEKELRQKLKNERKLQKEKEKENEKRRIQEEKAKRKQDLVEAAKLAAMQKMAAIAQKHAAKEALEAAKKAAMEAKAKALADKKKEKEDQREARKKMKEQQTKYVNDNTSEVPGGGSKMKSSTKNNINKNKKMKKSKSFETMSGLGLGFGLDDRQDGRPANLTIDALRLTDELKHEEYTY